MTLHQSRSWTYQCDFCGASTSSRNTDSLPQYWIQISTRRWIPKPKVPVMAPTPERTYHACVKCAAALQPVMP